MPGIGRDHIHTTTLIRRSAHAAFARRYFLIVVTALAVLAAPAARAGSLPDRPFGPGIDPESDYDGQRICDPNVKPGVRSFRRIVMKAFPSTGKGYFTRDCSIGGRSEHKEGRAWDWMVSAYDERDAERVDRLFDWLLRRDPHGNRHARVRRLGIMYMIWNHRMWSWWDGWEPYYGSSPHTDHVHFSFSWPGARKKTTYWNRARSLVTEGAGHPRAQGFWSVTGNANVRTAGKSRFHGDQSGVVAGGMAAGIAATPTGEGYWLVKKSGKVRAYGDARDKGSFNGAGQVVDIAATPAGHGYWTVTRSGRVAAFGNANHYGHDRSSALIAGIAPTPNGTGYWLVSVRGRVFGFGNARGLGQVEASGITTADIEAAPQQGYWLVTRRGRVFAFGSASFWGDARAQDVGSASPVVSIVSTPSGSGYWLLSANGRVRWFGNATRLETRVASPTPVRTPARVPVDPAPDEDKLVRDFLRSRRR